MSKNTKGRRSQRSSVANANPRSYSELLKQEKQRGITPVVPEPTKARAVEPVATASMKLVDWTGEYAQVFADLRQLLVISAILIVLMIVLGFVI